MPYRPGQFITLALPRGRETLYRSYSLCGDGTSDIPWEITIKRQRAGVASHFLFEHVTPGILLHATAPRGRFTLPDPVRPGTPLVFVAAGSGITPIYSMLRSLAAFPADARPRVQLYYASSTEADVIYGRELDALDPQRRWLEQRHYVTSGGKPLTPERVLAQTSALTRSAHWFICGPEALKRSMEGALRRAGIPEGQIHVEVHVSRQFGQRAQNSIPLHTNAASAPLAAHIRLAGTGKTLDAMPGETLLEALERHGCVATSSCRAGECGVCQLRVLSGKVQAPDSAGLTPEEQAHGYVLSCVAQPIGDVTLAPEGIGVQAGTAGVPVTTYTGKTALRIGAAAAAVALFAGAWTLTNHTPTASATETPTQQHPDAPNDGHSYQTPQAGRSGVTTQPGLGIPDASSGAS
jgi:ferredoxin-NADP reductase